MAQGSMSFYTTSAARTLAGFVVGLFLAFFGDLTARIFSLLLGYPWPPSVHQNLLVIGAGFAAGVGAFLAWMNLSLRWNWILGTLLLVLVGSIGGAYLGHTYGPGPDPTYWWSRYASDKTIYLTAATGGIVMSTILGLARELLPLGRRKKWKAKHLDQT